MFDPDAGMPRLNRYLVYFGSCIIAGLRLARKRQACRAGDPYQPCDRRVGRFGA